MINKSQNTKMKLVGMQFLFIQYIRNLHHLIKQIIYFSFISTHNQK
jgi:hypothetical protein